MFKQRAKDDGKKGWEPADVGLSPALPLTSPRHGAGHLAEPWFPLCVMERRSPSCLPVTFLEFSNLAACLP